MDSKQDNLLVDIFIKNTNSNVKKLEKILNKKHYSTSKNIRKLKSLLNNFSADMQLYDNSYNLSQKKKSIEEYEKIKILSKFIKDRIIFFENKVNKENEMTYEDIYGNDDMEEFNYKETIKEIKKYLGISNKIELEPEPPYNTIFKNSESYNIFLNLHNIYRNKENNVADYSSIFYALKKGGHLICGNKDFINFIIDEYSLDVDRIDSRHKNKKLNNYNAIITE